MFSAGITARCVSDPILCLSGKATVKVLVKWQERRATEWNSDLIAGCVSPGHPVFSAEECKRWSCGSSWMEALEDDDSESLWLKHPHNYPLRPFSWTTLSFFSFSFPTSGWSVFIPYRQICRMGRWMDVTAGWTALWVDAVSAVGPVALVIVSELCLNKALSKSLRWRGARCLTRGPSVGTRRGQLGPCDVTMSVLVEHLSSLILTGTGAG